MRVKRAVLDTNVFISALLSSSGKPFACLSWVLDNATLLASRDLLLELETRLARPKFEKYVDANRCRWRQAARSGHAVTPDDDKLLEIAVIGNADCIVTAIGICLCSILFRMCGY